MTGEQRGGMDPDVRRELDRIAATGGRRPTFAHPDCVCLARQPADHGNVWSWRPALRLDPGTFPCPVHDDVDGGGNP